MDNSADRSYLSSMRAHAITMLAIIAVAIVTALTAAHAVRMGGANYQTVHVAQPMPAGDHKASSCDDRPFCGSTDDASCMFVCANLSVFLTAAAGQAQDIHARRRHGPPSPETLVSRAPGLTERPPRARLL